MDPVDSEHKTVSFDPLTLMFMSNRLRYAKH